METTIKDLENNIRTLPESLYREVNDFIDFLKTKYKNKVSEDWAEQLSESDKKSIEKGFSDIENGNVYSHEEAKRKIKEYIDSKLQ